MGHLVPPDQAPADGAVRPRLMYHQLYIYDPQNELENRLGFIPDLNEAVAQRLQEMLHAINPFVRLFRTGAERLQANPDMNLRIIFRDPNRQSNRTYNRPCANEVGGIMLDDGSVTTHERDIVIERRGAPFPERISYMHPSYMPMQYPLLFPMGDLGWHNAIPLSGPNARAPVVRRRRGQVDGENSDAEDEDIDGEKDRAERAGLVTLMRWFAYRLFERANDGVSLRLGGRLFQQFLVDAWACIEQARLLWVRLNQAAIRSELYSGTLSFHWMSDVAFLTLTGCFASRPSRFPRKGRWRGCEQWECWSSNCFAFVAHRWTSAKDATLPRCDGNRSGTRRTDALCYLYLQPGLARGQGSLAKASKWRGFDPCGLSRPGLSGFPDEARRVPLIDVRNGCLWDRHWPHLGG